MTGRKDVSEYFGVQRGPRADELGPYIEAMERMAEAMERARTCAVIMAAYKAERFIEEALDSIDLQAPLEGWRYETRIGVDGCEATSAKLTYLGIGHWFSPVNVGPYVVRNSLILQAPAAMFATFDADDRMHRTYLHTLIPLAGSRNIAGAARRTVDESGRRLLRKRSSFGSGQVSVFSAEIFKAVGGFRSWRMVADADFQVRALRLGYGVRRCPSVLFDRRRHAGSISMSDAIGQNSAASRKQWNDGMADVLDGKLTIIPEVTPMEWRE